MKSRVKVVLVTPHYPPYLGGIERVVQTMAKHLSLNDLNVSVITSNNGLVDTPNVHEDNISVSYLKGFKLAHTLLIPKLFSKISKLPKGSIVHIHSAQAFTPEVAFFAARFRRLPIVIHVHSDAGLSGKLGIFLPAYKKIFLGYLLRHANRVIVLTDTYKKFVCENYKVDEKKISVIPNGVDDGFFLTKANRIKNDPIKILFVGRLTVEKNVPMIIEAVAKATCSLQLDIVGDGAMLIDLMNQTKSIKNQKIIFHGQQSPEQLVEFYRQADALVLASDYEGQPGVIMEAMASGTPVIGTDVTGIREIIGKDGLLVKKNALSLSLALDRIASSPMLRKDLSARARNRAKGFRWEPSIIKLMKIYNSL